MKKWLPLLIAFVLFAGAVVASLPPSWRAALPRPDLTAIAQPAQAPRYAADFAAAFCRWDAPYLSGHGAGALTATADEIAGAAGNFFDTCLGVRYLGPLDPSPRGDARQVFVLHLTDGPWTHDEVWVFTFQTDGRAVGFAHAD